jgi:hypothetical protein
LDGVRRLVARAKQSPAEREQRPAVAVDQRLENALRAGLDLLNQTPIRSQPQQPDGNRIAVTDERGLASSHHGTASRTESTADNEDRTHPDTEHCRTLAARRPEPLGTPLLPRPKPSAPSPASGAVSSDPRFVDNM